MLFNDLQEIFINVDLANRLIRKGAFPLDVMLRYRMYEAYLVALTEERKKRWSGSRMRAVRRIAHANNLSVKTIQRHIKFMES